MKILLFGGTSEGRELAQWLQQEGIPFTVSVATEYGEALLPAGMDIHVGRLGTGDMTALLQEGNYTLVIDATHPYATAVTENIQAAAAAKNVPCLRLLRSSDSEDGCLKAESIAAAAKILQGMEGSILLTTGSKELDHFAVPGLRERCYPRVLPMLDSLERCHALGFPPQNIICMQGPFTREMNTATLRQYHINILVTKDTGGYGGFQEKAEAAREAGCQLLVVERPRQEEGLCLTEIQNHVERLVKR